MPAKISLTGVVRAVEPGPGYFRLTMEEGGSTQPPKGLPPASAVITYTVLVAPKLAGQLNLPASGQRVLIQGELTLDLPLELCPGEIGVIAFQGQVLPDKAEKPPVPAGPPVPTPPPPNTDVPPPWPDLSGYPQVPLDHIQVPAPFLRTPPNQAKTAALRRAVQARGQLDRPVQVRPGLEPDTYVLVDEYRRYVVAQELGWATVPVDVKPTDALDSVDKGDGHHAMG